MAVLLVGVAFYAAWLLTSKAASADHSSGSVLKIVSIVLTAIGILALLAGAAMALMHWGMMAGMMDCCR